MNLRICFFLSFLFPLYCIDISAKNIEVKESMENENRVLAEAVDIHLTDAVEPLKNSTVNLASEEAWLYFDNMKPSAVLQKYKKSVHIQGEPLDPEKNARISIYKQGTVVIPHPSGYQPLETYTETNFGGKKSVYSLDKYYTNQPFSEVPSAMSLPLTQDNSIRSFKLKKGYMATFANEPDGMGYSRIYIADQEDLMISDLPTLLDKKISFVRVFNWEWVSKKGWVGSIDKGQTDGLKYVEEQCDKTNSTWFYNWGATTDWTRNPNTKTPNYNQEFCPEKWGAGGSWKEIFGSKKTSHLLGYNEPDHKEQSNVSVDKAMEEWPKMIRTGMRLGSPATTDFNWLYDFLNRCEQKNYRVDYVVVHAYWGGKSPDNWYKDLKTIHERSGRPIWIKEWNNGANWTNEGWPSGTAAQQEKQLRDLKGILTVMDTAHFIERYSIYNWVADKRALLLSGKLTPAGEYYAENSPELAYSSINEVIPGWKVREEPVLSYTVSKESREIKLSWTDYNKEMISSYIIERSLDNKEYKGVAHSDDSYLSTYSESILESDMAPGGSVYYRVKSVDYSGKEKNSNSIKYDFIQSATQDPVFGRLIAPNKWGLYVFDKPYTKVPFVVFGTPTYRIKAPLTHRINDLDEESFQFKLDSWSYLQDPVFGNPDTIAYLLLPSQTCDFGEIKAKADTVSGISSNWTSVQFEIPFGEQPVIFATQITNNTTTTSVRVKNVTKSGFDICLQYEEAVTIPKKKEKISYVAMTPGSGIYDGKKIQVGRTSQAVVGSYSETAKIEFGDSYKHPAFFGFMQTESDGITSSLRIKTWSETCAEIFKDREISKSTTAVSKEVVGWLVIETDEKLSTLEESSKEKIEIRFNPETNKIWLTGQAAVSKVDIFSLLGEKKISKSSVEELDVSGLSAGVYILLVNGFMSVKFVKR